jgi:hypothetical protein
MAVRRGGEYDRWDLEVHIGALATARTRLTVEEHGRGTQLIRLRIWPRLPARTLFGLLLPLVALAAGGLWSGDVVPAVVVMLVAATLGLRTVQESGAALAAIDRAAGELLAGSASQAGSVTVHLRAEPIRRVRMATALLEELEPRG